MKIKKVFSAILLFSFLMGSMGIQKTHALGTPQIVSINPSSSAQVGSCISIRARVDWDSEFRSMRIRFGNEGWQESSETEFERNFCTNNYSPGRYTIRVEVAGQGDNNWSNPRVTETQYELTGQPEPSKGPSINQFNFSPSDGVTVGDSVNIHIKVGSNNPGATTLTVDCGGLSKNETSEVEFDSNWNTSGCPAESVSVLVCARAVDDPNWTNATCSTRSYTLSSPQIAIPGPTAQLWSDSKQLSNGQCTYLHWQTTNADRVDIDGNTVQNSGDQQVCPTVTKKYTLTAINQSDNAKRSLTIIVSSQPLSQNVTDNFQTGNVISIGYDIFVIVNGERRLVPNPETLDALGISRDWIDNKGFGDSDLKTIPLGQDIPDINRDPAGFAAFKNQYFSSTTPIVPSVEQPAPNQPQEPNNPSNGQWQVGARVGLCAGAQIRSGSGFSYPYYTIVPESNWQVDIIGGPRNNGGVTWWDVSRKNIDGGGTGWIYFEQAHQCESAPNSPPVSPFSTEAFPNKSPITSAPSVTDFVQEVSSLCTSSNRNWRVGFVVGLKLGTIVYTSPILTSTIINTINSDNFAVYIKSGPQIVDGFTWWQINNVQSCESIADGWIKGLPTSPVLPPGLSNTEKNNVNLTSQIVTDADGSQYSILLPPAKKGYRWVTYKWYQAKADEYSSNLELALSEYKKAMLYGEFDDPQNFLSLLEKNETKIIIKLPSSLVPQANKIFSKIKLSNSFFNNPLVEMSSWFTSALKFELLPQIMAALRNAQNDSEGLTNAVIDSSNWTSNRQYLQVPESLWDGGGTSPPNLDEWVLGILLMTIKKAIIMAFFA